MLHHPLRPLVTLLVLSIVMMACLGTPSTGGPPGMAGAGGQRAGTGGTAGVPGGTGGSRTGAGGTAGEGAGGAAPSYPDARSPGDTGGAQGGGGQAGSAGQPATDGPPAVSPPVPPPDPDCVPSKLYGRTGELLKPDGRIIDPSYAGYRTGEPIPDVPGPGKRVTDFGAKPDDDGDDSQAFQQAIAMTDGLLLVPAGKYVLTQRLDIRKSNFVLRGEGMGKTTLYFPRPLGAIYGGDFTFSGGFITVTGNDAGPQLATVTANAARGTRTLMVSETSGTKAGDWVRVIQADAGNYSLFRAMYGDMHAGNTGQDAGREVFHHYSRVTAVGAGSITLERPLPLEVNTSWKPTVRAVRPTAREVGIEYLTMEMMGTRYPGHFNEAGYNGIYFQGAHDSWIRDVTILNADYGVHFNRSFFCTATGVVLDTNFDRGGVIGHHGLNSSSGQDVVFSKFDLRKKYVHDLSVDSYAMITVFSSGKGVDLNFDHHGRAPYATLWTNIDVGMGARPYASGGSGNRMPHAGAYTTLWNVYGARPVGFPASGFGPLMNFVGVTGTEAAGAPGHYSVETIPPGKLCQKDLYEAMVAARRAGAGRPAQP